MTDTGNLNRRAFIGAAGAFAFAPVPGRIFAADERPLFRMGVMTDTHVGRTRESCSRVQAALGHQLAFPDDNHVPSCGLQLRLVARVALAVADDFLLPELGIGRRAVLLAPVSVPETAVHKNHRPPFAHHDVGPSRQRLDVQSVAESLVPQPSPHHQLRLGVASLDAAHATVPLFRCHPVRHLCGKITTFPVTLQKIICAHEVGWKKSSIFTIQN